MPAVWGTTGDRLACIALTEQGVGLAIDWGDWMRGVFVWDDLIEIHRDSGGHYHHWSVLVGRLEEGSLSVGQHLALSTTEGVLCSAVVGGFEAFRKVLPSVIHAQDVDFSIGVMLYSPALTKDLGFLEHAYTISRTEHQENLRGMLARWPSLFFHNQRGTTFVCGDCPRALSGLDG